MGVFARFFSHPSLATPAGRLEAEVLVRQYASRYIILQNKLRRIASQMKTPENLGSRAAPQGWRD